MNDSSTGSSGYDPLIRRHLLIGWWSLLLFLSLGIALEAMHGFKVGWYLNVSNETRRLLWTLGHAHGTLLSLVHIAFAASLARIRPSPDGWTRVCSACLSSAGLLLPGGFLLGGLVVYGGDPGLGILLVPIGALFLLIGVFLAARGVTKST